MPTLGELVRMLAFVHVSSATLEFVLHCSSVILLGVLGLRHSFSSSNAVRCGEVNYWLEASKSYEPPCSAGYGKTYAFIVSTWYEISILQ